jgi:hypothetical protein
MLRFISFQTMRRRGNTTTRSRHHTLEFHNAVLLASISPSSQFHHPCVVGVLRMDQPDARSVRRRRRDTDNDLGVGAETPRSATSASPPSHSKPPTTPTGLAPLGDSYSHHTQIAQLWLRSRLLLSDPSDTSGTNTLFRTQGEDRPLTLENVWLAIELVGLIWRRFLGLFWGEGIRGRVGVYVLGRGVAGILPTAR